MEEKSLLEEKQAILKAISDKDYDITIDEPNNLSVRTRSDGSEYIVVYSMDDARSSTYFGSCTIDVAGHEFTCELEWGEWSCDIEELLDDEEILDAIKDIDGMLYGEMTDMDSQIEVYNAAHGTNIQEYFWCEDDDCPMDPDDMSTLDDFNWGTYEYDGKTYYLVDDEINEADDKYDGKKWGYGAYGDPDDYGKFNCVILLFEENENEDDIVIGTRESDTILDNDGYLE